MGDLLDLLLLLAVVVFAISGYRQGMLVGVLSFVGFIGGGALGALIAPHVATVTSGARAQALVAVAVVFAVATIGQLLTTVLGTALRSRLRWKPVRLVDSAAGAVVSIVSVLLVAWLVGTAVARTSAFGGLSRQVRHSIVLHQVDRVMPDAARTSFGAFRRLLDQNNFPQVFGGLAPERIVAVKPPDPKVLDSPGLKAARSRVLKVRGDAECHRRLEGTGFVYAPQHLMTNAHVVAGVRSPRVLLEDGSSLKATVVLYDPRRDVAVLYVPALSLAPLSFDGTAERGASAVVAGYPADGPFTAVAARIRGAERARGADIYQRSQVTREIYALRAKVRPGNSGGPLLAPNGEVYGVVFAAAVDDPETGYALTAAEVRGDADRGRAATTQVSSGGCD
jgi:S1-C subfamily serine protease